MRGKAKLDQFWVRRRIDIADHTLMTRLEIFVNYSEAQLKRSYRQRLPTRVFSDLVTGHLSGWDAQAEDSLPTGRMCWVGHPAIVMTMKERAFRFGMGVLAHEVVHAVDWTMRQKSIPITRDTEEIRAYLTGFFMLEALRRLT